MSVCCCDDATKTRWKLMEKWLRLGLVVASVDGEGRKRKLSGWGEAGLSRLTVGAREVLADLADLGDLGSNQLGAWVMWPMCAFPIRLCGLEIGGLGCGVLVFFLPFCCFFVWDVTKERSAYGWVG